MDIRQYKPSFLKLLSIAVVCISAMYPTIACSGTCTFNWQLSDDQNLDHFNVYIGTSSGKYNAPVSVEKATSYTFNGLRPGQTYFLAVKAVDASGNEIVFSDETTCTVEAASLGDSMLQGMEDKYWESYNEREKKIEPLLKSETLTTQELIRLQHELYQLQLQTEITTKPADNSSQGVQTLFKNQ